MNLFLDIPPPSFWNAENGSGGLMIRILLMLVVGVGAIFGLMQAPANLRRPIVAFVTFISGLFYVLLYLWPVAISRNKGVDAPRNVVEHVGFWLDDAVPVVANFTSIVSGFLLGLGVYSLLRVHGRKLARRERDWAFSAVLIVSMALMVFFGYADWKQRLGEDGPLFDVRSNWNLVAYGRDFLFEGLLQQMDAAMFSVIAFYILSAAYRAFRVRTIEATILLAAAFIMIFSLMGSVENAWSNIVTGGHSGGFLDNLTLTEISSWIRKNVQTPAIRGIDFGVGIGALAMGLRLWLSLERTGGN